MNSLICLKLLRKQVMQPLADWTNYLVALGDFQNRIDLHAAHHIAMGKWHDTYVHYNTDIDLYVPSESNSSILWLKTYINALLSRYGVTPQNMEWFLILLDPHQWVQFTILDSIEECLPSNVYETNFLIIHLFYK